MTVVFLPVSLYKVKFKVAAGRPFSRFERLVLKAINTGTNELDGLVKLFCVHRRMVVESLVTLMQAGWVWIESRTNQFGLTPSGIDACKQEQSLPPLLRTEDRWQILVMERVAGQIARGDKVKPTTKKSLAKVWQLGAKIPKADISNTVDPGMARPLLSGRSGERVRWVGPITTASDNNAFVVVGVDTISEQIIGIPKSWEPLLAPDLLERARRYEHQMAALGQPADDTDLKELVEKVPSDQGPERDTYNVSLEDEDLAVGQSENRAMLERFLMRSESFIVIASSKLRNDVVTELSPLFEEALTRGKSIYICWGHAPGLDGMTEHRNALKVLEKLQWVSRRGATAGRLVIASSEGQFFANVVIGDVGGWFEAAVGSHSWLGQQPAPQGISVQVRHPGLVARLCDVVGDYQASDERLKRAGGLTRLRNAAWELSALAESSGSGSPTGTVASLVFDRHHAIEIWRMISSARESVSITCDRLEADSGAEPLRLIKAAVQGDRELQIRLLRQDRSVVREALGETLDEAAMSRVTVDGPIDAPGNCVIADTSAVLISSYPSLGPSRSSQRPFGSEIGLKLSGGELTGLLLDRLNPPNV